MMYLTVLQNSDLVEKAFKVSPYTQYVYGFLVFLLVVSLLALIRYVHGLIEKTLKQNNEVLLRNTLALENSNTLNKQKITQDSQLSNQMITVIAKMELMAEQHEQEIKEIKEILKKKNEKERDKQP